MQNATRVLMSTFWGALVCAILTAVTFFLLTLSDGSPNEETIVSAIIVGLIGALVGALIGLIVGIGNLGVIGGGLVGILLTLAVAASYVALMGRPENYRHFLSESRVLFVVFTLPTILTGVIIAWRQKARSRAAAR